MMGFAQYLKLGRWKGKRSKIMRRRNCRPIFALDDEGEVTPVRHSGVDGLWYMVGNLSLSRFFSTHLALREWIFFHCVAYTHIETYIAEIKAIEEGIYGTRYEKRAR